MLKSYKIIQDDYEKFMEPIFTHAECLDLNSNDNDVYKLTDDLLKTLFVNGKDILAPLQFTRKAVNLLGSFEAVIDKQVTRESISQNVIEKQEDTIKNLEMTKKVKLSVDVTDTSQQTTLEKADFESQTFNQNEENKSKLELEYVLSQTVENNKQICKLRESLLDYVKRNTLLDPS